MEKILFKEEQRFTQTWYWLLIAAAFLVPMVFLIIQLITEVKIKSGEVAELKFSLVLLILIGSVLGFLFWKMKLMVEITPLELRFKYPPFLPKWNHILKDEIDRFEVRKYKPITEYGGWGIKTRVRKRNIAYNVKGNIGLQLYLKNGRKILLGTQKKQAIEYAMGKMMQGENSG